MSSLLGKSITHGKDHAQKIHIIGQIKEEKMPLWTRTIKIVSSNNSNNSSALKPIGQQRGDLPFSVLRSGVGRTRLCRLRGSLLSQGSVIGDNRSLSMRWWNHEWMGLIPLCWNIWYKNSRRLIKVYSIFKLTSFIYDFISTIWDGLNSGC